MQLLGWYRIYRPNPSWLPGAEKEHNEGFFLISNLTSAKNIVLIRQPWGRGREDLQSHRAMLPAEPDGDHAVWWALVSRLICLWPKLSLIGPSHLIWFGWFCFHCSIQIWFILRELGPGKVSSSYGLIVASALSTLKCVFASTFPPPSPGSAYHQMARAWEANNPWIRPWRQLHMLERLSLAAGFFFSIARSLAPRGAYKVCYIVNKLIPWSPDLLLLPRHEAHANIVTRSIDGARSWKHVLPQPPKWKKWQAAFILLSLKKNLHVSVYGQRGGRGLLRATWCYMRVTFYWMVDI